MVIWIAVILWVLMALLWLSFLFVTRQLPNQPFRKWDRLFYVCFIVLTAIVIQWSLYLLDISDLHQRRTFAFLAIVLFLIGGAAVNVIFNYWPGRVSSRRMEH
jgi:hypothetical protein